MSNKDLAMQLRIDHPEYTLQQIGTELGVTRERVRQILKKNGLETCKYREFNYCDNCGGKARHNNKFCSSVECRLDYYRIDLKCAQCGKIKKMLKTDYINKHINNPLYSGNGRVFCNKVCQGRWLGTNYGRCVRKAQTHCKRGHDLSNAYVYTRNGYTTRKCKECHAIVTSRRYYDNKSRNTH